MVTYASLRSNKKNIEDENLDNWNKTFAVNLTSNFFLIKNIILNNIKKTQLEILKQYSTLIKPNGKMVYATCSILPSENEYQIKNFLDSKEGEKFKLEEEKKISPFISGFDGFYMARLSLK